MTIPQSSISQRIQEAIDFDKRLFFLILVILFLLIRYVTNDLILQSITGYEQLEADGSFTIFHIFNALNYFWTPFALLWKFTVTASVIWTGGFAFGYKTSFVKLWQFILVAEVIFIFPELIKLLYFIQPSDSVSYENVKNFYPLSLYNLADQDSISPQYIYPLQAINLFEVLYIVALMLGFHTISRRSISESTIVVIFSYVICLLIWLGFYIVVYKS
ncbi:sulfate ABC transporter permease [Aquiflexum sp.]|uniref:sulfate ABC transporter permease n=1 Tax=Aquiflexum sp. TaxID=1872584 RepID=UPI003594934D